MYISLIQMVGMHYNSSAGRSFCRIVCTHIRR